MLLIILFNICSSTPVLHHLFLRHMFVIIICSTHVFLSFSSIHALSNFLQHMFINSGLWSFNTCSLTHSHQILVVSTPARQNTCLSNSGRFNTCSSKHMLFKLWSFNTCSLTHAHQIMVVLHLLFNTFSVTPALEHLLSI